MVELDSISGVGVQVVWLRRELEKGELGVLGWRVKGALKLVQGADESRVWRGRAKGEDMVAVLDVIAVVQTLRINSSDVDGSHHS